MEYPQRLLVSSTEFICFSVEAISICIYDVSESSSCIEIRITRVIRLIVGSAEPYIQRSEKSVPVVVILQAVVVAMLVLPEDVYAFRE